MDRIFNKGLVISMGLIILLLIGNAWLGYHNIHQLNKDAAQVAHTQEVMDALEEVVSTMKDAQTGERGYIITGETRYLKPYDAATATIEEKIQRLQRLTEDNLRQQARIPPLQQRIQDEIEILKRNIALGKKDLDAARRAVATGEKKKPWTRFGCRSARWNRRNKTCCASARGGPDPVTKLPSPPALSLLSWG